MRVAVPDVSYVIGLIVSRLSDRETGEEYAQAISRKPRYETPVLRPPVDTEEEVVELARLEGLTSRRPTRQALSTGIVPGWGQTFVSAPFSYRRTGGNRFDDEMRSAR